MRFPLLALLLASFLGLGLTTSALRAQGCEECARSKFKADDDKGSHPVVQWFKNGPWYCWAHHNTLGCSSLSSEFMFVFGSCRQFYGEPCFKGPPPPPGANGQPYQPIEQRVGP